MSGNKQWSIKVGAKLLSDLVTFSILSSEIPEDLLTTLIVNNRKNFSIKYTIFIFFRFSIFIANFAMYFNLFKFYRKHFNIILSFFLSSLRENKFVQAFNFTF